MKKLWKRNQIMITALALMIAIAGYLNFMGKKVDEENLFTTSAQFEEASGVTTEDGTDMAAVTDITDESLALLPEQAQEEIFRYYFLRQPQRVIGVHIGRTRSTAGRHIQLALQRLRRLMEGKRYE